MGGSFEASNQLSSYAKNNHLHRRIQDPVTDLRGSFLGKQLTTFSRYFQQIAPPLKIIDKALHTTIKSMEWINKEKNVLQVFVIIKLIGLIVHKYGRGSYWRLRNSIENSHLEVFLKVGVPRK